MFADTNGFLIMPCVHGAAQQKAAWTAVRASGIKPPRNYKDRAMADSDAQRFTDVSGVKFRAVEALV